MADLTLDQILNALRNQNWTDRQAVQIERELSERGTDTPVRYEIVWDAVTQPSNTRKVKRHGESFGRVLRNNGGGTAIMEAKDIISRRHRLERYGYHASYKDKFWAGVSMNEISNNPQLTRDQYRAVREGRARLNEATGQIVIEA